MGATTLGGSSKLLAVHTAAETVKWGQLVQQARIQTQ
jgi:hypothetical protein